MKKTVTKSEQPLPCRFCGSLPITKAFDCYFRDGTYLTSEHRIFCSNPLCSKEHRHFQPRATKREVIMHWNYRNKKGTN